MSRRQLALVAAVLLGAAPAAAPALASAAPSASAAAAPAADAPARAAAAPRVKTKAIGSSRTLLGTRTVTAAATTVKVGRKRCAVAAGTPLAALLAAARKAGQSVAVADYGSCSSRAADGGGLYVTKIGPDRRGGQAGWVFAVDGRVATAGAADVTGPFGSGPLRAGQTVVWFWCARAGACGRVPR